MVFYVSRFLCLRVCPCTCSPSCVRDLPTGKVLCGSRALCDDISLIINKADEALAAKPSVSLPSVAIGAAIGAAVATLLFKFLR